MSITGEARTYYEKGIFCKAFRCLPSQLRNENYKELILVAHAIREIERKDDTLRQIVENWK